MWGPDDFPGASNVPWQLLIRARYVHEIDAVVASIAVAAIAAVAAEGVVGETARRAVTASSPAGRQAVAPEQQLSVLSAVADFDEFCGTLPRHWWGPGPRPKYLDRFGDPVAQLVLDQVASLVDRAGSPALQEALGGTLAERQLAA